MITLYLLILVAIVIFYVTRPTPNRKQNYRVAKGGDVDHVSPLVRKINDLSNRTFRFNEDIVDAKDYEIFVVDGESMSTCGIHTGNGVLVSRLFNKQEINNGSIVIYEINPDRYVHDHPNADKPQYGFKIRQFLGYANLNESNDDVYDKIKDIDKDLNNASFKNLLFTKLDKARGYYNNQIVTISITYKEGVKDYSVHSLAELYGLVKYIIPETYMKNN